MTIISNEISLSSLLQIFSCEKITQSWHHPWEENLVQMTILIIVPPSTVISPSTRDASFPVRNVRVSSVTRTIFTIILNSSVASYPDSIVLTVLIIPGMCRMRVHMYVENIPVVWYTQSTLGCTWPRRSVYSKETVL